MCAWEVPSGPLAPQGAAVRRHLGIDPAAVADRGQLGAPAFGSGQVHAVLALEASGTAGCTRAHAFREESVRDAYGGQHGDV